MSRIAYIDGRYVRHRDGAIAIDDRGFLFSDGVYEVVAVTAGRLVDEGPHLDRLARSLSELRIDWPVRRAVLSFILRELIRRNRVTDGIVYLEITRGAAPRDHGFPANARPSLVATARSISPARLVPLMRDGIGVITIPDIRWKRPDIKSVSLLPNVLAKQQAREAGAYEAWMVDDKGFVTEGSSTNAWIVTRDGALVTRAADRAILEGITRRALLQIADEQGLRVELRPFSVAEAYDAAEALLSSTTAGTLPVVRIDGRQVGEGVPGPFAKALAERYDLYVRRQLGNR